MIETCPICNGVLYRYNTGSKKCVSCGNKIKPESFILNPHQNTTHARIEKIKEFHEKNKNYNQKELRIYTRETEYMVSKYWKQYKKGERK